MSVAYKLINANVADPTDNTTIYLNETTSLDVTLTNNYADDIIAKNNRNQSEMSIYLPSYFTSQDIDRMIIHKADWDFSKGDDGFLILTYTGTDSYTWAAGADFTFTIEQVCESSATNLPLEGSSTIHFSNFTNNPSDTTSNELTLDNPPIVGAADLRSVLQVFLSNQGVVYVSSDDDVFENTLFLNFKNIGTDPLSTSGEASAGVVTVRFIYGNTVGALTNNDKGTDGDLPSDSAWNIVSRVSNNSGGSWTIANPDITAAYNAQNPTWRLSPTNTNKGIIGTGANANVGFSFSNIVSILPVGNTQMVVEFSGFMKDATTPYNDTTFALNIVKLNPPALRGLTNFSCETLRYTVANPLEVITLNLSWSMYYVNKVEILASLPSFEPIDYPAIEENPYSQPIDTDTKSINLIGIHKSGTISIIAQAYDANNNLLNRLELTVYVRSTFILDNIREKSKLLGFNSETTQLTVTGPSEGSIDLNWSMNNVNYVKINIPSLSYTSARFDSSNPTGFASDQQTIDLPDIRDSGTLVITLSAFDESNVLLDAMQFSVVVLALFFIDLAGNQYSAVQVGSKLWMTENLRYGPILGTYDLYNNYGVYYNFAVALANIPDGWRLPSKHDWEEIGALAPSLNLQRGGYIENDKHNTQHQVGNYGYYWSASTFNYHGPNAYYAYIVNNNGENLVYTLGWSMSLGNFLSVRYVRDIPIG